MIYKIIVSINLSFEIEADSEEQANDMLIDVDLPDNYITSSLDLVSIEPMEPGE